MENKIIASAVGTRFRTLCSLRQLTCAHAHSTIAHLIGEEMLFRGVGLMDEERRGWRWWGSRFTTMRLSHTAAHIELNPR